MPLRCVLLLAGLCTLALAAERELPVSVQTAGGSKLAGVLEISEPWTLHDGAQVRQIDPAKLKSLRVGRRIDPALDKEAQAAVADLNSDQFQVRDAASAKLKKLGPAALRALNAALEVPDPEAAARARMLIDELKGSSDEAGGDTVVCSDGAKFSGELAVAKLVVRTRCGRLEFPLTAIESIEAAEAQAGAGLVAADARIVLVAAPKNDAQFSPAERWEIPTDQMGAANKLNIPAVLGANPDLALTGARILDMGHKPGASGKLKGAALNPGDDLAKVYEGFGIEFKPTDAKAKMAADNFNVLGLSQGLSAQVKNSDCEILFKRSVQGGVESAAGVLAIGMVVHADQADTLGLAVYDRAGRLLGQTTNRQDSNLLPGGGRADEFIGMKSKIPIARARLFRIGALRENSGDLVFDDVVLPRTIPLDRGTDAACLWLKSGEKVVGAVLEQKESENGRILFRPEFMPEGSGVSLDLSEIERFEPPQLESDEQVGKQRWFATPHAILLQNGEALRAAVLKIDENTVKLGLAGVVELELPRTLLRKIDLKPESGEENADLSVKNDERPGVYLEDRSTIPGQNANPPAQPPNPVKPDKPAGAEEKKEPALPELVAIDAEEREITIKDEGGDWTIGLPSARKIVFAKLDQPKSIAARDWTLELRQGSLFDIRVLGLRADALEAEIATGKVLLPWRAVASLQRKK